MIRSGRYLFLGSCLVITMLSLLTTEFAKAATWSNTYVGYRFGNDFREPENEKEIQKNILSFSHISGYQFGSNYFSTDFMLSDDNDPALNGGGGVHEIYAVYRHKLSFISLMSLNWDVKIIKDIGIVAGLDLNSKNDNFGPEHVLLSISLLDKSIQHRYHYAE